MEGEYCLPSHDRVEEEVRQECSAVVHRSALNQPGSSRTDRYGGLLCLVLLQTGDETGLLPL